MRTLRTTALAVLLALTTTSLFADGLEPLGTDGTNVRDLVVALRLSRDSRKAAGRIKPNIVSVDWTKESFIIPAAGSVQGSNGTFFKSDVTIANRRSVTQIISVGYLARGVNNGSAPVQNFSIPANTTIIETDFVGRVLGKSGLGTILVVAKTSGGAIDDLAEIDGFSRIWTPQPPLPNGSISGGTVSQAFESIDLEDSLATSYGYGLRQDAGYRTNVGLVNLYDTSNTFTVNVVGLLGSTQFNQTVQPYSMEQPALPAGTYGDLYIRITSAASNFNWWSAYGTTVDNITGDGWVSHVH